MPRHEIVIVGAGPAGVAAAVQCARLGGRPLLLDETGRPGGLVANAYCVENYPGIPPTPGPRFVELLEEHLARFRQRVTPGRVTAIRRAGDRLVLDGPREPIEAERVILAAGTAPRKLKVPGASALEGRRLHYQVHDLGPEPAERVVVVGAGEAAFDYALSLARRGAEVTICARGPSVRVRGRLASLVESEPRIRVEVDAPLRGFALRGERVLCNPGDADERLCDRVVAAIGRTSRAADLLAGLDGRGDGALSTEVPGLLLAGDIRRGTLGQAGIAVGDGLEAAMAAVRRLPGSRR